jgi:hypothetical protein
MSAQGLDLALFWIGVAAAIVMPVRYWIGSKHWYRFPMGWLIMSLAAIIILLYSKGVVNLATGQTIASSKSAIWTNGVVAGWVIAANFIINLLIKQRRAEVAAALEKERQP